MELAADGPAAPLVRTVKLPGRGSLLLWECAGPPGAPCLVLLHGVTMTAELNWSMVIRRLGQTYHVIAPDLRGHGDGLPCGAHFSLEECADDVAALAETLGLHQVVVVGYSMGGLVAQLVWRRHRALVAGLVLCATARNVSGSPFERLAAMALPAVALTMRWNPAAQLLTAQLIGSQLLGRVDSAETRAWARRQLDRTSLGNSLAAVLAVSQFSSHDWIGGVDVPTAVLITTQDTLLPPSRQRRLAAAIPRAKVVELAADHGVCAKEPADFASALVTACALVAGPAYNRSAFDSPGQAASAQRADGWGAARSGRT